MTAQPWTIDGAGLTLARPVTYAEFGDLVLALVAEMSARGPIQRSETLRHMQHNPLHKMQHS